MAEKKEKTQKTNGQSNSTAEQLNSPGRRNYPGGNILQTGKTALITGASSGIGCELAGIFARDGFNLVLVARDVPRLAKIADEMRQNFQATVTVIPKDLSQPAAAEEIYREIQSAGIEIDILVNNAGFNVYGAFSETDIRQESEMIQVNIVALTRLTKLFLPGMLKRNFGRILNLASTASFVPGPLDSIYCAGKAYVLSFSEALAEEHKSTGVTVTALCPGSTKTEFAERAKMTDTNAFQGRLLTAAEVAQTGYRALMRGQTSVVVGLANKLMVFALRFTPRNLSARIAKNVLSRKENASQTRAHPAR